jgi:hypothetical protein
MNEKISRKISELRQHINGYFCLGFYSNLIKENERGIAELEDTCTTDRDFVLRITNLASLIDDIDGNALALLVERKPENRDSIHLLEEFLDEKKFEKGNIIENLRIIKRIRNTVFPIHRASKEFLRVMSEIGEKPPFNWSAIWGKCLEIYCNSLMELLYSLDAYNSKFEYSRVKKSVKKSEEKEDIFYLNDYLYRYRILIPTRQIHEIRTLIDYITAALIAYEKNLKSIDYALRKYAIPLKRQFRTHAEDPYFAMRRRYVNNEQLRAYGIMVSRDDVGIKDDAEFLRYFRYIWVSFVAYQMGVQPDWIIKEYSGLNYISKDHTYIGQKDNK